MNADANHVLHNPGVDALLLALTTDIKILRSIIEAMTKAAHEREQRIEFLENTIEFIAPLERR
jgi:hypothetical protein